MHVATKLFFVGSGLFLMAVYNQQARLPTHFNQGQKSVSPPIVLRPNQQASPPTEIATPSPYSAETPYPASSSPTVEVRRASPADSPSGKWPDGRVLVHPRNVVQSHVISVPRGEWLEMRGGPGTVFIAVAEIPFDAVGVSQFTKDGVWDGDTRWYPVEWHGHRGYVGGGYLQRNH
jgi:hypothetical protein